MLDHSRLNGNDSNGDPSQPSPTGHDALPPPGKGLLKAPLVEESSEGPVGRPGEHVPRVVGGLRRGELDVTVNWVDALSNGREGVCGRRDVAQPLNRVNKDNVSFVIVEFVIVEFVIVEFS